MKVVPIFFAIVSTFSIGECHNFIDEKILTLQNLKERVSIMDSDSETKVSLGADVLSHKYSLNLVLTSISCPGTSKDGSPHPSLQISSDSGEGDSQNWNCWDINVARNWEQVHRSCGTLKAVSWTNETKSITIKPFGDWSFHVDARAYMIASVYFESVDPCPDDHFNCNVPNNFTKIDKNYCIPSKLKCELDPNPRCGTECNGKETISTCREGQSSDYIISPNHHEPSGPDAGPGQSNTVLILGVIIGSVALLVVITSLIFVTYVRVSRAKNDEYRILEAQEDQEQLSDQTVPQVPDTPPSYEEAMNKQRRNDSKK